MEIIAESAAWMNTRSPGWPPRRADRRLRVGTEMGVSADAPYLDSAYKLAAYDGRPDARRPLAGAAAVPP